MARSGIGRLGGRLAQFGRTLGSLALRFAPLLLGALKGIGAAFAALSLPVTAAIAVIAGGAYLVWKHWEPISKFFASLWGGVRAAFSSFGDWLSSIDWSGAGRRLVSTLAEGVRNTLGAVWDALKGVLGKLADLLPGSDARTGPLSRLTASGAAILSAMGEGVRRSGAGALQRPLSRALGTAAAGLALTIPATAEVRPLPTGRTAVEERLRAPAALLDRLAPQAAPPPAPGPPPAPPVRPPAAPAPRPAAPRTVNRVTVTNHITITQRPGEDPRALARRVAGEIDRLRRRADLGRQYDD